MTTMDVQMKQAQRVTRGRTSGQATNGSVGVAAPSSIGEPALEAAAQRMNAGPHAASLSALQAVVAQRACADCEHVRRAMGGAEPVQRAAKSPGGLPDGLRAGLENLSGRDLSGVSVHYDSPRPAQLNAHAFAQGPEIHVAPGQEKHLPHEGWHAVQQMQNRVRPTMDLGGTPVNDSAQLEREADVMGARALSAGGAAQMRATGPADSPVQRRVAQRPVAQRFPYATEAEAIVALRGVLDGDVDEAEQFRVAKRYLDYAVEQGWDGLEDVAIGFVRRVEDEDTARVLARPRPGDRDVEEEAGLRARADAVAPDLEEGHRNPEWIVAALREPLVADLGNAGAVAAEVDARIALFLRIRSILQRGILRPSDLEQQGVDFTPSSDSTTQDRVSFFDIDQDRPGVEEERFGVPGRQSIGPVLERRNDAATNAQRLFGAARRGTARAVERLAEFRGDFAAFFQDDETTDTPDGVERLTRSRAWDRSFRGRPLLAWMGAFLVRQPEFIPVLERRAARSAMFVSSGAALADSSVAHDRARGGARVQELRVARPLEAQALTHLLIPRYLSGFAPLLGEVAPAVEIRTVANTVNAVEVGYYDQASTASTKVDIRVPDYQSEIERLMGRHRQLLTHITNIA